MRLPMARGPVSDEVIVGLRRGRLPAPHIDEIDAPLLNDDLQLALWVCNELSYRGFSDVDDDAVAAFLALALADTGREREALSVALLALTGHMERYRRSLESYAQEL